MRTLAILAAICGASTLPAAQSAAQEARPVLGPWVDPSRDEPAGTHYKTLRSATIGGDVSYLVWLPPDYNTAPGRRYPVIYWLHGGGGNQRSGSFFVDLYAGAVRRLLAPAAIIVLPNGLRESNWVDSKDGKSPVETVIIKDLVPHIDQTY